MTRNLHSVKNIESTAMVTFKLHMQNYLKRGRAKSKEGTFNHKT